MGQRRTTHDRYHAMTWTSAAVVATPFIAVSAALIALAVVPTGVVGWGSHQGRCDIIRTKSLQYHQTTSSGKHRHRQKLSMLFPTTTSSSSSSSSALNMASKRRTIVAERAEEDTYAKGTTQHLARRNEEDQRNVGTNAARLAGARTGMDLNVIDNDKDDDGTAAIADDLSLLSVALTTSMVGLTVMSETANAVIEMPKSIQGSFDPSSFVPVCAASDGFYRFLQSSAQTIVGRENFVEYGPLIASGLLRVRLELCVVESFFNEAVGPFISQNGLSWVLPVHETVETFLAGTVFALATTFILVGSTKLLTVILTYADFLLGGPLRFVGGYIFDRARGKPVTVDVGIGPFKTRLIGPKDVDVDTGNFDYTIDMDKVSAGELPVIFISGGVKAFGQTIGLLRETLDAIDLFVGKSLVLWVTAYVLIKFLHFKVFPDFPPIG